MGKTDSTGSYLYVCDGTTPGSPVLADGHTLYTPGLSENRGGTSIFYSFDRIGNLWTLDGTTKNQLGYADFTGFGSGVASAGMSTPLGFRGGNGCQTDADTGLVLMGHRYYDPRTGRFISQDPAGSGNNWYAYAGNNPVNKTDPSGLMPQMSLPEGSSPQDSSGYLGTNAMAELDNMQQTEAYNQQVDEIHAANALAIMSFVTQMIGAIVPQISLDDGTGIVGGAGDLIQLITPNLSKEDQEFWNIISHIAATRGAALGATSAYTAYESAAEGAYVWSVAPGMAGMSAGLGLRAAACLVGYGLGAAAAIGGAGLAGWETGTWISKQPLGPGGQTVSDFWAGQLEGTGNWMQQNTSFGH